MNHETELKHESDETRISSAVEQEPRQDRKPWVTPVVSESPVNELTAAAFVGIGVDGGFYS